MRGAQSRSAGIGWKLGLFGVVAFVGGPLLAHREVVPPLVGFGVFALGGLLGLAALVAGVGGLLASRGGGRAAVTATLLGLCVGGPFLWLGVRSAPYPAINDITTDTDEPPEFIESGGRDLGYPGADCAARQRRGYPSLAPLVIGEPPDAVFEEVRRVAGAVPGWTVTHEDTDTHRLQGVDTTWLFRFRDDFVIRVRRADGGSRIDMRSKSRDGRGDLGANARRIRDFFARIQQVGGTPGAGR